MYRISKYPEKSEILEGSEDAIGGRRCDGPLTLYWTRCGVQNVALQGSNYCTCLTCMRLCSVVYNPCRPDASLRIRSEVCYTMSISTLTKLPSLLSLPRQSAEDHQLSMIASLQAAMSPPNASRSSTSTLRIQVSGQIRKTPCTFFICACHSSS
jgi:hypothetical protein